MSCLFLYSHTQTHTDTQTHTHTHTHTHQTESSFLGPRHHCALLMLCPLPRVASQSIKPPCPKVPFYSLLFTWPHASAWARNNPLAPKFPQGFRVWLLARLPLQTVYGVYLWSWAKLALSQSDGLMRVGLPSVRGGKCLLHLCTSPLSHAYMFSWTQQEYNAYLIEEPPALTILMRKDVLNRSLVLQSCCQP